MIRALCLSFLAFCLSLLFVALTASAQTNLVHTAYPLYAKAITPHDSNALVGWDGKAVAQSVYVGGTGNVVCLPAGNADGDTLTFLAVPAGAFIPVMCRKVLSTGTTATSLIGIY